MKQKWYLLFLWIAVFPGCGSPSDSPCMGGGGQQVGSTYIQTIYTSDSSSSWIGADTLMNGTFVNSNGFVMHYKFAGIQKNETREEVGREYVSDDCGFMNYKSEYVNIEQKTHKFTAVNLNFSYSYVRKAVYSEDTTKAQQNSDILSITINNTFFDLPINNEHVPRWEKRDSMTLGNKLEYDVYRVYLDTGGQNQNIIVPAGIYYTKKKGLIGFYFSNGELWLK